MMAPRPRFGWLDSGFWFGAAEIVAAASLPGRRSGDPPHQVVQVKTGAGVVLDIYISPTGRSVRVFRDRRELK